MKGKWDAVKKALEWLGHANNLNWAVGLAGAALLPLAAMLRARVPLYVVPLSWSLLAIIAIGVRKVILARSARWRGPAREDPSDALRRYPGLPLHGMLDLPQHYQWERLIEFFGIDWHVVHAGGHAIGYPQPRCPACRDDMGVESVDLPSGEHQGTSFECSNPSCGYATVVVPVEPSVLVRQVGEMVEAQLRREARG